MFSDHLQKIDKLPYNALLIIAAGLVFLCQLVAMVLVVDGQVEKAQIRDAHYSSAQMVIADCSENYSGPARSRCIEQMRSEIASSSAGEGEADAPELAAVAGKLGRCLTHPATSATATAATR